MRTRLRMVFVAAGLPLVLGCGAVQEARQAAQQMAVLNDLKEFGLAYLEFHESNRQGPASWDELLQFMRDKGRDTTALERVRDTNYTIAWSVQMRDATVGIANYVLAYQPGGGPALMLDGSVFELPADELQARLDAQQAK